MSRPPQAASPPGVPSAQPAALPPCYAGVLTPLQRLRCEVREHLWPWSSDGFRRQRFLLALSAGLAVVVSIVWLLAAVGRIGSNVTLAWWVGWSVFEVLVRLQSKPYIKDGPWWGRNFRRANLMDMICYVSFKNLLIAAGLFLAIRLVASLDLLPAATLPAGWQGWGGSGG